MGVVVRPIHESELEQWRALYRGYAEFYEVDDPHLDRLWRRIIEEGSVECFVAEADGALAGFAHVREFVRPLDGGEGGYLDDLYVDPGSRGYGVGAALLEHLRGLARERGWSVVRWITADDNVTAQRLYDRHAQRTPWVTYDMSPDEQAR
jgi:ribosomal protein S18 acetylase RimI-like enzyme